MVQNPQGIAWIEFEGFSHVADNCLPQQVSIRGLTPSADTPPVSVQQLPKLSARVLSIVVPIVQPHLLTQFNSNNYLDFQVHNIK